MRPRGAYFEISEIYLVGICIFIRSILDFEMKPYTVIPSANIKASTEAGCSNSKMINHFVEMGFPEEMVAKAIRETGMNCFNLFMMVK